MNQLNHRMPLFSPIILMVSFSLASFSYTTLFRMMATEYIQASVMKRGMERLITRRKLRQRTRETIRTGVRTARTGAAGRFRMFSHVIYVARIRHLLNVHARLLLGPRHGSDNALLNDILQVREPTPDVPHVFKRVGTRTWVPVPEDDRQRLKSCWFHQCRAQLKTVHRHYTCVQSSCYARLNMSWTT